MLTKILTLLILPPGCVLLLLLLAFLLRLLKLKKTAWVLAILAFLGLYATSTPYVADALTRGLEDDYPPVRAELSDEADVIVVLGGAMKPALAPRFEPDLDDAADRMLHALRLYRQKKAPKILASGGTTAWSGAKKPESARMADLFHEWGVPPGDVWMEKRSEDSHDNATDTASFLKDQGVKRILLVTSAMHMPRAVATFEKTGLEVIPSPTDFLADAHPITTLDWMPSARALEKSHRALKERLGLVWYRIRGWAD